MIKAAAKQAYRWDNAGWTPGKVVLVCAIVTAIILACASGLHAQTDQSFSDRLEQSYADDSRQEYNFRQELRECFREETIFVSSHHASVLFLDGGFPVGIRDIYARAVALKGLLSLPASSFFEVTITDRIGTSEVRVERSSHTAESLRAEFENLNQRPSRR